MASLGTGMSRREFVIGMAATSSGVVFAEDVARSQRAQAAPGTATKDFQYRATGDLVAALAQRKISATELLEQSISRIAALDGRINAVVVHDFERARAAAAAADAALAR